MLISISGSQGSGKSTIMKELQTRGFKTIERKTSRSILSDWKVTLQEVNNDPDLTIKFQNEIVERKFHDELKASASLDVWYTERSYGDLFTYALIALGNNNQYSDWIDEYYINCMRLQQTYDMVYYLKAGHFSIQHDGVRGSNSHYSRLADTAMYDFTQQMTHPTVLTVIDTPIIEQRVSIISTQTSGMRRRLNPYRGE